MPEPADQPAKPPRTWRPMALWAGGIVLAAGLAVFLALAAVACRDCSAALSVVEVHDGLFRSATDLSATEYRCFLLPAYGVHDGGPAGRTLKGKLALDDLWAREPAAKARRLRLYLLLPRALASRRAEAAYLLAGCGQPGVAPLAGLLSDGRPETRRVAAWALGRIGPAAAAALPGLERLSGDADPATRVAAAEALNRIRATPDLSQPIVAYWDGGSAAAGRKPFPLFAAWEDGMIVRRLEGKEMVGFVSREETAALLQAIRRAGFFTPSTSSLLDRYGLVLPDGPVQCLSVEDGGGRRTLHYHGRDDLNRLGEIGPSASPSRPEVATFVAMWKAVLGEIDKIAPKEMRPFQGQRPLAYPVPSERGEAAPAPAPPPRR